VAGGNLHMRKLTPASSMVVTNVCLNMWVHPRHPDRGAGGQVLEPAGGGVAVHPGAEGVA
jgi:hypothetical protein